MTKTESLIAQLKAGWVRAEDARAEMKWQPHTLRGFLSRLGRDHNIERKREEGVTSYRIVPREAA